MLQVSVCQIFSHLEWFLSSSLCLSIAGSNGIIGGPSSSGSLLLPSLQRLVLTCDLANRWSHGKAHQFLAAWNVGAFLLVTQSDLKVGLRVFPTLSIYCSRFNFAMFEL